MHRSFSTARVAAVFFSLVLVFSASAESGRRRLNNEETGDIAVTAPRVDTGRAGLVGLASESNFWRADRAEYSIGFERAGSAGSALPQNAVLFGTWMSPNVGFEAFLGFTHVENGATQQRETTRNKITNSGSLVITNNGTATPSSVILGGVLKYRVVQTSWFQFYVGALIALAPSMKATYAVGTRTENTADLDSPTNYTVSENGWGNVEVSRGMEIAVGPKIGAEFYLKWFPHIGLGFSTGILTSFGGDTTTTTNSQTRNFDVINGVDDAPTVLNGSVSRSLETKRGTRAATFGLGGSEFQFNGIFTIRYIW